MINEKISIPTRYLRYWVNGLVLLTPIIATIQMKAMVIVLSLWGLVALGLMIRYKSVRHSLDWPLAGLLAATALYGGMTALWSLDPALSGQMSLRLALLFLAIIAAASLLRHMPDATLQKVPFYFTVGMGIALGFLSFEFLSNQWLYDGLDRLNADLLGQKYTGDALHLSRLNRSIDVFALLLWPLMILLWQKLRYFTVLIPIFFCLYFNYLGNQNETLNIVAACSVFMLCLSFFIWKLTKKILLLFSALLVLGFPTFLDVALPLIPERSELSEDVIGHIGHSTFAAKHRLFIWDFVNDRIDDKPLLGWGLQSSRRIGNFGVTPFNIESYENPEKVTVIPLHPHNAVLQLRLELGLPGVLLGAALMVMLIARFTRESPGLWAITSAFITALSVMLFVRYGLWQFQWLASLACIIFCHGLMIRCYKTDREPCTS